MISQSRCSENTIEKRYIAIVKGIIDSDEGTVELPIGRPDPDNVRRGVMEGGAPSVTHYKVIDRYREHTMVELLLETGRTHQIRVHMSHIVTLFLATGFTTGQIHLS